ncbi:hypothetical protein BpHYR1_035067 [Brachionus plicatilis]|uniref:Uncharacterized protein n=1 Tax=Brachionus plicatilis TaxID=10195 RepID=A0A3M7SZB7_BRAPC|nr:hypothetical protein BpHYR1_035067 [Brachionus plicatilis]
MILNKNYLKNSIAMKMKEHVLDHYNIIIPSDTYFESYNLYHILIILMPRAPRRKYIPLALKGNSLQLKLFDMSSLTSRLSIFSIDSISLVRICHSFCELKFKNYFASFYLSTARASFSTIVDFVSVLETSTKYFQTFYKIFKIGSCLLCDQLVTYYVTSDFMSIWWPAPIASVKKVLSKHKNPIASSECGKLMKNEHGVRQHIPKMHN